ncbi:hypothetical protein [Eikenella halliae]|uniref:hypothetical protein n=1 Tax=Eikenella halliae TaxID=1795832 RepID=UPI0012E94117|nr:hypothetical protein [Eikenella halliae]
MPKLYPVSTNHKITFTANVYRNPNQLIFTPNQRLPESPKLSGSLFSFQQRYSTVTDLAKLRGLSTSVPRTKAAW